MIQKIKKLNFHKKRKTEKVLDEPENSKGKFKA